jgi:hypothetical protein
MVIGSETGHELDPGHWAVPLSEVMGELSIERWNGDRVVLRRAWNRGTCRVRVRVRVSNRVGVRVRARVRVKVRARARVRVRARVKVRVRVGES